MYQVEGGHLLCLHCYRAWQEMLHRQIDTLRREVNYIDDLFDEATGMTGLIPRVRFETATPVTVRTGTMTFNNVTVKDSVVGAINQGQIQRLDIAIGSGELLLRHFMAASGYVPAA